MKSVCIFREECRNLLPAGHVHGQLKHSVRIAVFVVVPDHYLRDMPHDNLRGGGVHNSRMGVADDVGGDELFFELVEGPGSVSEGVYSYEPTYEESGEYTVTIKVSDSEAETTGSFTVVVLDVNRPPIVDVRDDTVNEGHQYELYIRAFAYDPDGDDISFEILEGPGTIEGDYYTYEADFGSFMICNCLLILS